MRDCVEFDCFRHGIIRIAPLARIDTLENLSQEKRENPLIPSSSS